MVEFFKEGGVGMFPTVLFGFLFFASAVLYTLRPDRKLGPIVIVLGAVTIASGVLGLTMGLSNTMGYLHKVAPAEQLIIGAQGISESLNNLILALLLFLPTSLLGAVGAFRSSSYRSPSAA